MVASKGANLVSVIMPMYATRRYLAAAMNSVLTQRGVDLELVVVDDGTRDGSIDLVRKFHDPRVRVVEGPRAGIAEALNAGLRAARGDVITRCDSDDLYAPGRLAFQSDWLRKHPEFGALCGGFTAISRRGFSLADMGCGTEPQEITHELREGTLRTSFCTFATAAHLLHELGGFRPFFRSAEDVDLQLRLGEICRVWFHPRNLYFYRLHDASVTHQLSRSDKTFYEACARWLQRQRVGGELDELQLNCPSKLLTDPVEATLPRQSAAHHVQGLLLMKAWRQHAEGRRIHSILTGVQAGLTQPKHLQAWKSIAALMVKLPGQQRRRRNGMVAPSRAGSATPGTSFGAAKTNTTGPATTGMSP